MKTNLGYKVSLTHDFADRGYKYRFTTVSGTIHVDEYVASCNAWVYCGHLV